MTGWLPEEAVFPVTLESVYVSEFHADAKPAGEIYLDDLCVSALPAAKEPPEPAP